ncbi:F-box only protein 27 isoform X2 [Dendrobates tinctorius]|uniref:F-box only protein 27 isoform X2 n=1 Tax=Dendrobates tinctorius TaxID=92724 RepID=UPI003CCA1CE5
MGQGGSQELPPDQPTSAREESPAKLTSYQGGKTTSSAYRAIQRLQHVAFFMDLEPFPEEILLLILSFVPAQDLVLHCRPVSRRWRRLVDSPSLWRIKCERDHRREILYTAEMCPDVSWQRVYLKMPFSRNLLQNPFGAEQLKYWDAKNGGDGWKVEDNCSVLEGAERPTCFVTSFGYAGRHDCGCVYRINVELLAANKQTVLKEFSLAPEPIPQWNDTRYHQVSYEFRHYGPGVRYVKFIHRGKDTKFWKGWYGARITNSSVTVKCHNLEPCT